MTTIYLGLGSNMGDREATIARALDELNASAVKVTRISPIYETEPRGLLAQDWFLNAVARAETELAPLELLRTTQTIEQKLERRLTVRNGPRTIDIDILFYGRCVVRTPELEIPHPRYRDRRFVLAPLFALEPELLDPLTGTRVSDLLNGVSDQDVRVWRPT